MPKPRSLKRLLDLGLGLKVRNAASRGRVRDGREDDEGGGGDGLGRFDEVEALLILGDFVLAGESGHCAVGGREGESVSCREEEEKRARRTEKSRLSTL